MISQWLLRFLLFQKFVMAAAAVLLQLQLQNYLIRAIEVIRGP